MNWARTILDGLLLCLVFNLTIALLWTYIPNSFKNIVSSHMAGVSGFWNLFWTGYIEMFFINLGDFIGLDYFFRKINLNRVMIPGTEHCKAWETKNWMKTLGIPEHLVIWPLVFCPLVGLIVAGISSLVY